MKILSLILLLGLVSYLFFDFTRQNQSKQKILHELAQETRIPHSKLSEISESDTNAESILKKKIAFGQRLFFDPRLSANADISCASCHQPDKAFSDGLSLGKGIGEIERHTMPIFNMWSQDWFFWDGRADSLISQVQGPLFHPKEHGFSRDRTLEIVKQYYQAEYEAIYGPLKFSIGRHHKHQSQDLIHLDHDQASYALTSLGNADWIQIIVQKQEEAEKRQVQSIPYQLLSSLPGFIKVEASSPPLFAEALNDNDRAFSHIADAIAQFELSILAHDSPFDRFVERWQDPENPQKAFEDDFSKIEFNGFELFAGKAGCVNCHFGPNFSDGQFHNIGLPTFSKKLDLGRAIGLHISIQDRLGCEQLAELGFPELLTSESCREKPFLDLNSLETLGSFKTPSLRQLKQTAPYMHDGRFLTLEEVLHHYNLLEGTPTVGHREETLIPLNLSKKEINALLAFLESLNGRISFANSSN